MFSSLSPARRRILIWMVLGVLALLLLAGSLGTFKMEPGKVFVLPQPTQEAAPAAGGTLPGGETFLTIMRGALAVLLILMPISLIAALFSKEGRRRLIMNLILIAMFYFLAQRIKETQKDLLQTAQPAAPSQELKVGKLEGDPLPPLPSAPSDELVLIASVMLVVAGIALAAWVGRRYLFSGPSPALAAIAKEADRGRSALAGGEALEDAIIRTYRQMSRIVAEARELHRPVSATPREFEQILEEAGLPAQPLAVLTHLFEEVRYGDLKAGPQERQAAIDSLTAIAAACRAQGEKRPPRRTAVQHG